ncbi:hypothetical protein B9Z55_003359 [Caenorhabditis nigoni]|uniref:DUF7154 domain-containing protein n=1 Tax=Caenorhabditis nigoni TaxID=1611254 RepID=A0A2G5VPT2_9PELO|nr:hypothetical protein B9Z55_003359 [Caenorhabditis nigoni]
MKLLIILLPSLFLTVNGCLRVRWTDKCSPTDPSTFLLAYSNDLDYSDVQGIYRGWGEQFSVSEIDYAVAATVRFDTKTKEDVVFHDSDTFGKSQIAAYAHMNEQQMDPSQRFDSSETGSDVLDTLEAFSMLTNIHFPYAYLSSSLKVSGTGKMVLSSITIPQQMRFLLGISVQSTVTPESFQNLTLSWSNSQFGTSGSFIRNRGELDQPWYYSSMNSFMDLNFLYNAAPSTYELTLDYSYSMEDTVLIRMYSDM